MTHRIGRVVLILLAGAIPRAALAYDEAASGDLSSVASAPTPLIFAPGINTVTGTVTSSAPADTRDYFTFTIPAGHELAALRQVSYTAVPGGGPGNRGFHAINAGPTGFVPAVDPPTSFLGGDHMDQVASGTDLLPELSDGDTAGVGFSRLGAGTYTYLIQQTGADKSAYSLQFVVAAIPRVPASSLPTALLTAGLLALIGVLTLTRRRSRPAIG